MLFGQRRFQLRADGLNAFNLVKVIKIRTVVVGEVGKQKLSVCEAGCILPLPESGFVIVAANDDGLVRKAFFHGLGHSREIVCGKGHINRPACGKMDTCACGKPLTNGNGLFRLPLNDELSSRYLAAHEKTLCSIRIDALQTLQIVCGIHNRNKQRAVPCLPYAFQSCNALAVQIGMVGVAPSCRVPFLSGQLSCFSMAFGIFRFALPLYGVLTFPPCGKFGHGKRLLFFCAERALFTVFPVAPPKCRRDIDMRDICAVLFMRFGLGRTTMQFSVRHDFGRNQSLVGQDVPKDLQGITHDSLPDGRGF